MSISPRSSASRVSISDSGEPVVAPLLAEQLGAGLLDVERGRLQRRADPQPHLSRLPGHVVAGDRRPAAIEGGQGAEHAGGRRLPGAIRTQEAIDLAAPDGEIDIVHGDERAEAALQPGRVDSELHLHASP